MHPMSTHDFEQILRAAEEAMNASGLLILPAAQARALATLALLYVRTVAGQIPLPAGKHTHVTQGVLFSQN